MSEFSKPNYEEPKMLTTQQPPDGEKAPLGMNGSVHLFFFFILTLAGTVLKRGNAIAKTYQAWAASGKSGLGFHPLFCCFRLLPISISQDESVDTLPVCQQDSLGLVGRG